MHIHIKLTIVTIILTNLPIAVVPIDIKYTIVHIGTLSNCKLA